MACGGDVFTIRQDDGYPASMLHRVHLFLAGLALSALTVSLVPLPVPAVEKGKAVQAPAGKAAAGNSKGGQAWSFGASRDRNNALWHDGVETESLHKRALGRDRGNSASIEHALREADRHAKAESRKAKEAGVTTPSGVRSCRRARPVPTSCVLWSGGMWSGPMPTSWTAMTPR